MKQRRGSVLDTLMTAREMPRSFKKMRMPRQVPGFLTRTGASSLAVVVGCANSAALRVPALTFAPPVTA